MGTESIEQSVKEYVLREFLPDEDPNDLAMDTPLITGGILDSIATIRLVSHLEESYGVRFEAHEVGADHFDTISSIAEAIESKRA
jgi:acyl carrier protein